MNNDPFDSPKLLLNHAREHIENLNARGQAFVESKPYAEVCELDGDTEEYVYSIRLTTPAPAAFALVAADALNNLKSVLDQTVCGSVILLDPKRSLGGVCFPFGNSADHFKAAQREGCKKVAPEIVTVISGFHPYKGGNDPLWLMNSLSKMNRHRILQPVIFAGENRIAVNTMVITGPAKIMAPVWDRSKNELIFARTGQPNLKYDLQFSLHIAFGDVDIVAGQPAIPILRGFADIVERIVAAIEGETRRVLAARS